MADDDDYSWDHFARLYYRKRAEKRVPDQPEGEPDEECDG